MLRAETTAAGKVMLSGRIERQDIPHLTLVLASETTGARRLDLREVTGVDADGVEFLRNCEKRSFVLEGCPPYIRSWIDRMSKQET